MKVKKKNGNIEVFDEEKIIDAVIKSAVRIRDYVNVDISELLSKKEKTLIKKKCKAEIFNKKRNLVTTEEIHQIVIKTLADVAPDVGEVYRDYHNYKIKIAEEYSKINETIDEMVSVGDKSNANSDSLLVSTQNNLEACIVEKSRFDNYFVSQIEKTAMDKGFIYCHDRDHRMLYPYNCSDFLIQNLIDNEIEINGVKYTNPNRISSWFAIIGDMFLSATASQYGGFTVPRFDTLIGKQALVYEEKLRKIYKEEFKSEMDILGIKSWSENKEDEYIQHKIDKVITKEIQEGLQGLEYTLNTVSSSRGDFPFTSITIGISQYNNKWAKIACMEILKRRAEGIGSPKKPAIFPKLIFLYDETLHGKNQPFRDIFEQALKTSCVAMMPDYSSNTGIGSMSEIYCRFNGIKRNIKVNKFGNESVESCEIEDGWSDGRLVPLDDPRRKSGKWSHGHPELAVSPMGCRSYLSPAYYHRERNSITWDMNGDGMKEMKPYDIKNLPDGFSIVENNNTKFTRVTDGEHVFTTEMDDFMYPYCMDEIPIYEGRQNNGVISLNLPMIYERAKLDKKDFYELLDYYLELIRNMHIRTLKFNGSKKSTINPYGFQYGGLIGIDGLPARLKNGTTIDSILMKGTASYGITGLNELQKLHNKRSILTEYYENKKNDERPLPFLNEVIDYIQSKINEFRDKDNIAYSLYGTPAENLSGVQFRQFKKMFPRVCSDNFKNEWFSNSFHIDVTENTETPYEKQNIEYELFHKLTGGHIQYCRVENTKNLTAVKNIVENGMKLGFYSGINILLSYCEKCGHEFNSNNLEIEECPKCRSKNITVISRLCGYSGYVKRGSFSDGESDSGCRVNQALKNNIMSRKSM